MGCSFIATLNDVPKLAPLPPITTLTALPVLEGLDPLPELAPAEPAPPAEPVPPALPALEVAEVGEVLATEVSGAAPQIVSGIMDSTGALAIFTQSQALAAIENLANFTDSITALTAPTVPVTQLTLAPLATAPVAPDLTPSFPTMPVAPVVGSTDLLALGDAPVYDVAPADLLDLQLPDPMTVLLPGQPALSVIPVALEPGYVLPAMPTLLSLNLPELPEINIPLFDAALDQAPQAPDAELLYSEVEYSTVLLSTMNSRLSELVTSSQSGLDPDVEQAIVDRARDREALLTHRTVEEALRLMNARGFRMPEGSLVRIVQQALQAGLQRDASLSRGFAIVQAQLAQANFKFALDTAIQLESRLIEQHNQVQARSLEAAKAALQSQLQMFNARVLLFSADVQAFSMKATVFRTRLEAALSRIAIYRAQLDGQRLTGEINTQQVAIYKAQIEGVGALVEVYKSRVEAAKAQIESDAVTVENFRTHMQAFETQVGAKANEYEGYAARMKGGVMKAEQFGTQIAGYRSRVEAFDALAKAKIGVQTLQFKQQSEFPLEIYKSRIDAFKTATGAASEQLRLQAILYEARVRAFAATEGAATGHVNSEIEVLRANTSSLLAQAQLTIDGGRANLEVATAAAGIAQNNLRAAGQLAGQLSAAAIAAQGVHASISESGSMSSSYSESDSASNLVSLSAMTAIGSNSTTATANSSTTGTAVNVSSNSNTGRSSNRGTSRTVAKHFSNNNSTQDATSYSESDDSSLAVATSVSRSCTDRTTIRDAA